MPAPRSRPSRANSAASTGTRRSPRRAPRSRSRRSSRRTACPRVASRPTACAPAQAHDRRRPHVAPAAAGRQARARAGAGRRLRHHGGGDGGARVAAHQSGRRRAAPGRSLRPPRPHRQPRQSRSPRSRASPSAITSTGRTHSASRRWPRHSISQAAPAPDPAERAAAWNGPALLHEIGYTVSHIGLSQARRVHPRERRHARLFRARSSGISRCWSWDAAAGCRRWRMLLDRPDFARAGAGAAARGAVPPCAPAPSNRRASRCASAATVAFGDFEALAERASADRAPAGQGARRMDIGVGFRWHALR